jgi:RNA polymerase sigma-70 factor (ECF subfamily)
MKKDIKPTFEKIYEKESDSIFRFCLVRVSDRDEALNITQETFLRLWRSLLEGKEILNNKAFIFKIAHHLIIDFYRKKKNIPFKDMIERGEEGEEIEYNPEDEVSTSQLEIRIEGRYLLNKINELIPIYQQPIYLRFVEDLSPPEIGEILGISANAASVRINRGLIELRKKVGNSDEINKTNN